MMRLMKKLNSFGKTLGDVDVDDALRVVGLARRRSALMYLVPAAVGFLVIGGMVGMGIGLTLAPTSGRRLRRTLEERVSSLRDRVRGAAKDAVRTSATDSPPASPMP